MRRLPHPHRTGQLPHEGLELLGTPPSRRRERGAFAVMMAALLLVIFGFCSLAIDLARMYNRKVELKKAADIIALAAAAQLDGTDTGISNALDAARKAAVTVSYNYNSAPITWVPGALSFASSPYASDWIDALSATGKSEDLFFAKVDTTQLDAGHGRVDLLFLPIIAPNTRSAQVNSRAVAGRSSTNLLPLAICAMSQTEGQARGTELVEYGFRRGISYDLMQLNPTVKTKGANFLVNPVAPSGTTGTSVAQRMDVVQPFVCTGTLAIPPVKLATPSKSGGTITVEPGFPLSSVWNQLNSRFGTYTSPCTSTNAPPDTNVKAYAYLTALTWMNDVPTKQSAEPRTTATALMTLPDLQPADIPADTKASMYGPLWLYAKPAQFSAYKPGVPEPATSYATFGTTDWPTLYPKGTPKIKAGSSYPTSTPYSSSAQSQSPSGGVKGVANRRILNIPLLRCPVSSGSPVAAEVLAIGKFFMTVPATNTELYAEFAGLAQPPSLVGRVELYP